MAEAVFFYKQSVSENFLRFAVQIARYLYIYLYLQQTIMVGFPERFQKKKLSHNELSKLAGKDISGAFDMTVSNPQENLSIWEKNLILDDSSIADPFGKNIIKLANI